MSLELIKGLNKTEIDEIQLYILKIINLKISQ